mgnify:CR=1 FL=1
MYIIAAILIFGVLIAVHELGHFLAAKACGVRVNEFSIGMGPVLWKKTRKGTQYSLRALPVGGFVALEGEESPESQQAEAARDEREAEDENPVPPEQRTGIPLNEAPVWQRVLVMVAGAFMNFVLGFVVLLLAMPLVLVALLAGVVGVLWGIGVGIFRGCRCGIWPAGAGTVLTVLALLLTAGYNHTAYYPSLTDLQSSLTIYNSSSSRFTLYVMAIVSILVPFVAGYIWYVWRAMGRKRISEQELQEEGDHLY